jgi:acyl-CoA hydrolase
VLTATGGLASVQVRLMSRTLPDSAVVEARAMRANGQIVPGSSVTFVVEFQP